MCNIIIWIISFYPSRRWDILTDRDILIKLPQEHIVASLNLSKKLIDNDNFKNYKFIDLRVKNHLVAKWWAIKNFEQ